MNDFLIAKESKFTGILPVAVLIYIAGLVLVPKNIPSFITLNLAFATGLALIYLVVSTYWLLYNRAHEKQD